MPARVEPEVSMATIAEIPALVARRQRHRSGLSGRHGLPDLVAVDEQPDAYPTPAARSGHWVSGWRQRGRLLVRRAAGRTCRHDDPELPPLAWLGGAGTPALPRGWTVGRLLAPGLGGARGLLHVWPDVPDAEVTAAVVGGGARTS